MSKAKFKTLTQQVRWCLEHIPETRNSDIDLMIEIWKKYFNGLIFYATGIPNQSGYAVMLDNIKKLPREDHIKRIRAKIQNQQKEFLPTEEAVAIARGLDVEWWREEMRKVI